MDCNACKENRKLNEPIPYAAFEIAQARMDRANKRLWIAVLILVIALLVSNAGWIYYESQFEDVTTTEIEQDTGSGIGNNYIVGGDFSGQAESKDYQNPLS